MPPAIITSKTKYDTWWKLTWIHMHSISCVRSNSYNFRRRLFACAECFLCFNCCHDFNGMCHMHCTHTYPAMNEMSDQHAVLHCLYGRQTFLLIVKWVEFSIEKSYQLRNYTYIHQRLSSSLRHLPDLVSAKHSLRKNQKSKTHIQTTPKFFFPSPKPRIIRKWTSSLVYRTMSGEKMNRCTQLFQQ